MKNDNLIVSEAFSSIQGEGVTMGVPAIFLRLAGCNLLCKSEHWVCDTIEVWQKGVSTPFEAVLESDFIASLHTGAHLVITGGEPMLHQKAIKEYLKWFKKRYKFIPTIEIETNGTKLPEEWLFENVDYWNVSPKLSTSGEPWNKRFNKIALARFSRADNAIFKFVISCQKDIGELFATFGEHIDLSKLVFMPAGENQEQLNKMRLFVAEKCRGIGVKYSDRLHIVIWNQKTGI